MAAEKLSLPVSHPVVTTPPVARLLSAERGDVLIQRDPDDESPLIRPRKNALVGVLTALTVWVVPILLIFGGHLSLLAVAALAAYGVLLLTLVVNRARRAARRRRMLSGDPVVLLRTPVR